MTRYLIGIDGGGTKTEGILADAEGRMLARCQSGPSNPNDVTLGVSADTLAGLARQLLQEGDVPTSASVSLFAGVAGALNHKEALTAALRERLSNTPVTAVGVDSDARILLTAGLGEADGACLICGTGSACFVRVGETVTRIGGWGYLLDSGGNGYAIGRDAIEAALLAHDGRGAPTSLTARLADHYGAPIETLITAIYREGKPYIASAAPAVFAAAKAGDAVAEAILVRNAAALADCIRAAWARYAAAGCQGTMPVVMGGSISQKVTDWPVRVAAALDPSVKAAVTVADTLPVLGALCEAMRQAKGSITDPAVRARLADALRI